MPRLPKGKLKYTLRVRVGDGVLKKSVEQEMDFEVEAEKAIG